MNDVDKMVLYGSEVRRVESNSIPLVTHNKCRYKCGFYYIDNFTKYSVAVNSKDELLYGYNPHYGWYQLSAAVIKQLPIPKIQFARKNHDKEVMLNEAGSREASDIKVDNNGTISRNTTPRVYRQDSYVVENGCVWLSACLLIRSQDSELAEHLVNAYKVDPEKYEWLRFHNKGAKGAATLSVFFKIDKRCCLQVCKVKIPKEYENNVTEYILNRMKEGLVMAVLHDNHGNRSHTIGINIELRKIYDCMENCILDLNQDSLSQCCGPHCVFEKFGFTAVLKDNRVHEKKS